jgi:hypothetical protein
MGVSSSIIAAILTYIATYFYNKRWYKSKYGKLAGNYKGYGYEDLTDWKVKEEQQSKATIIYKKENILEIEVANIHKNDRYKWKGTIYMISENHGSVSWKYEKWGGEKFGEKKHRYGFKRLIVAEDENKIY